MSRVDVKLPLRITGTFRCSWRNPAVRGDSADESQRTSANLIDDLEVGRLVNFDLSLKVREKTARPVRGVMVWPGRPGDKIRGFRWSGDD
jgi:hypothetical protein